MIPGDISDVPTLACLNKPQKRAFILRDQLRYLEPTHLNTFLEGVTADEPPTYRSVNGNVWPPLTQITIKEDAARFDLGNVQFPEEGGKTCRTYLTVEDERFEMRTQDPLPKDDAELASVPIHRFVAENMFPLFKTKYKAIHARMEKMNEARRVAYNMLDHPPAKFEEGETLARLHSAKPKTNEDSSREPNSRKRKEITKHISNKRPRIGLETIPDAIKSSTFDILPAQIKIDLFNTIIKTAFPNFDNLIIASWNVVSVYANVGSDFPELHRAVVELKGVLEEFEGAYAGPRIKNGKGRKETTPGLHMTRTGTPVATTVKEGSGNSVPTTQSNAAIKQSQEGDSNDTPPHHPDNEDTAQHQMPPPPPRLLRQLTNTEYQETHHPDSQTHFTPAHTHPRTPRPATPTDPTRNSPGTQLLYPPPPGSELMRKRQAYASSLSRTKGAGGVVVDERGQEREHEHEHAQEREHEHEREREHEHEHEHDLDQDNQPHIRERDVGVSSFDHTIPRLTTTPMQSQMQALTSSLPAPSSASASAPSSAATTNPYTHPLPSPGAKKTIMVPVAAMLPGKSRKDGGRGGGGGGRW